jgi:hypothetical protein
MNIQKKRSHLRLWRKFTICIVRVGGFEEILNAELWIQFPIEGFEEGSR